MERFTRQQRQIIVLIAIMDKSNDEMKEKLKRAIEKFDRYTIVLDSMLGEE